jgi:TPP-dependent pyruvate/acetoin dehydrogenase alpha subunit
MEGKMPHSKASPGGALSGADQRRRAPGDEATINGIVEDAVRFAEESPYPDLLEALEDVLVQ